MSAGWPSPRSGWGQGIRCIVSPANDDMFEIDPIIEAAKLVDLGEGNTIALDGFTLCRPAGPTRRPGRRSASCRRRSSGHGSMGSCRRPRSPARDLQLPRPAVRLNLDAAPKLDADMKYVAGGQALVPVGSHAVRDAIEAYGPVLSLHGHIHEGRGAVKIGRTLAVNPGSTYEDGVLQAAIVDLDSRKAR